MVLCSARAEHRIQLVGGGPLHGGENVAVGISKQWDWGAWPVLVGSGWVLALLLSIPVIVGRADHRHVSGWVYGSLGWVSLGSIWEGVLDGTGYRHYTMMECYGTGQTLGQECVTSSNGLARCSAQAR